MNIGFVTYSLHFWFSIFTKTSSLHVCVSLGLNGLNGKTNPASFMRC